MPLLYGLTPFCRIPDPENVTSETKLFYINESGECFSSFTEMMERLTIIHASVWTCAVTKRPGLTFEEAVLSEKEGHKGFPKYGQQPILFIGYTYFQNASFTELVYGTYKIIRDRYFLNEWIRYHVGAKAIFARVIKVILDCPKEELSIQTDYGLFPPQFYSYVVEYFDHEEGKNVSVKVKHDQISRSTSYSSRNSLHKYFTEVVEKDESRIIFKRDEIERLEIEELNWDRIFAQPAPFQGGLKRKGRPLVIEEEDEKKELNCQLSKRPKIEETLLKVNELSDWDKYRATEKEVRIERDKIAEERLKLWKKMELSEDLDLIDLKILPQFKLFDTKIPAKEFGDVLNLYGFLCAFGSMLEGWDQSFTLKDLIQAIYTNERPNKPLLTLICCLVRTRNECVATEDYDEADITRENEIPDEYRSELNGPFGDEIKSRNLLLDRIRSCHGASLATIPVNEHSINQHIIYACHTAGNCPRQIAMEVRKELRGDLSLNEDELFRFSLENKDILNDLRETNVSELSPSQRVALLLAFSKNLLTYGDFRKHSQDDIIEMRKLTQRLLRLAYLERQYQTDYADTIKLMDEMFPNFKLKRNGHSKKVDEAISKFLTSPTVSDAILLTQMKTRFDYIEPPSKREELRKIQHNVIELRSHQIAQEMSAVYRRLGCVVLGMDRVFRQYIYVENLSLLFIEGPLDTSYNLENHCKDSKEESDKFESCTSDSNCPIHSCNTSYQWFSLTSDETLTDLMRSLNPFGLREGPLLANLKVCAENLRRSLNSMPEKLDTVTQIFEVVSSDQAVNDHKDYQKQLLVSKLLEFEEKLVERSFLDERFSSKRIEWRNALKNNYDTRRFCPNNKVIFDGGDILIFNKTELNSLEKDQVLSVSLFQIVNSLLLECLKEPFVDNHRGNTPIATTTFASWIHGLCTASTINEIFFYLASIESAIKWSFKVSKSIPCTMCGARGSRTTLIKCSTCSHLFHKACVKLDQNSSENWACSSCSTPQVIQTSRRAKPKPGHFLRLSTVGNISLE